MSSWGRAILVGFLVWLIPFVVSFVAFPLKGSWRSLFESIVPVVLSIIVVVFAVLYFRRVNTASLREGAALGALWFGSSVLIDLPLMLSPPIDMPLAEYVADIGLTYLMMPVITIGIAAAASSRAAKPA
jgi:hypothetical protein